ncbi:hypothetical protein [Nocardia sp. NPDC059228]|uniref:hypothetical protein n=1 Tax=Nocardia sp. NPDC059228 TaxID=3346777 RepID=UPI0036C0C08E
MLLWGEASPRTGRGFTPGSAAVPAAYRTRQLGRYRHTVTAFGNRADAVDSDDEFEVGLAALLTGFRALIENADPAQD